VIGKKKEKVYERGTGGLGLDLDGERILSRMKKKKRKGQ